MILEHKGIMQRFPSLFDELVEHPTWSMTIGIWNLIDKTCVDKKAIEEVIDKYIKDEKEEWCEKGSTFAYKMKKILEEIKSDLITGIIDKNG